jgi:hypothetical protein
MPGEFPAERGRDFVNRVGLFFDDNFGFSIYETAYEGEDAASVFVAGEKIRFDFLMYQKKMGSTSTPKIHFYCECKWRTNPRDLKTEFGDFLKKALKATPEIQRRHPDSFHFMFVCNKPFGIDPSNLQSVEYIQGLLDGDYSTDDLSHLSRRIGIVILPDWFLDITSGEKI